MKKIFLLMCLPFCLFSFEIDFSKDFQKKVVPDVLKANIDIEIFKYNDNRVNKIAENFNLLLKNNSKIIVKNSSYSLNPRYIYVKNEQKFVGYKGYLSIQIEGSKAELINEFILRLIALKNKLDKNSIKFNIRNISWDISKKKKEVLTNELRLKAIEWGLNYTTELSNRLQCDCKIKVINIDNLRTFYPKYSNSLRTENIESFEENDITPVKTNEEFTISAMFVMECE